MQDNKNLSPSSPKSAQFNSQGQILLDLTLPGDQLKLETKPLGKGAFGVVYAGKWGNKPVAVKQLLQDTLTDAEKEDFKKEAATMFQVSTASDHVVRLYKITLQPYYSLVMELMPKGNLFDLLQNNRSTPLLWEVRYRLAMDISTGLSDIHSHHILHCDLKSLNVLLDDRLRAKLADFGLASIKKNNTNYLSRSGGRGTVQWTAPEVLMGRKNTEASDVYSLGMIFWELVTHRVPFADSVDQADDQLTFRETIPEDCPKDFRALILDCWSAASKRPKALQIVDRIQPLLESKTILQSHSTPTSSASNNILLPSIPSMHFKPSPDYHPTSTITHEALPSLTSEQFKGRPMYDPVAPISPKAVKEKTPNLTSATTPRDLFAGPRPAETPSVTSQTISGSRPLEDKVFQTGYALYHQGQYQQAFPHLQQAADAGNIRACLDLGVMYELGLGVEQNAGEAAIWYDIVQQQEAELLKQGNTRDATGQFYVGRYYQFAADAKNNPVKASGWYRRAADQGHAEAQCSLGDCYANGVGVGKDLTQAMQWYEKAAAQGNVGTKAQLKSLQPLTPSHPESVNNSFNQPASNTEVQPTAAVSPPVTPKVVSQPQAKTEAKLAEEQTPGLSAFETGDQLYCQGQHQKALPHFQEAAKADYPPVYLHLGRMYELGLGVTKDVEESICWYAKAQRHEPWFIQQANTGQAAQQFYLGRYYAIAAGAKKNSEQALAWYRKAAEQGYAAAQTSVGVCYEKGQGVVKDAKEAVNWYRKAAEQGYAAAQTYLGCCYGNGQGVVKDAKEAVNWYRKAAEQGEAMAQFNLGCCYDKGRGVKQDDKEAVSWYCKAAEQGDAVAQVHLGFCYENGRGVKQDDKEAVSWYRKAAEQGYADAQTNLGFCYENGRGVTQDHAQAVAWFRRAAEQGDANAQNNLGVCYENGQGVVKDSKEAVNWYHKAAEQGHMDAQNNLGVCYENGRGVVQDAKEAVNWYRKAAEQGNAWGQNNLGMCYRDGQGITQDHAQAVAWFRCAAEQGNADAQTNLGFCYQNGRGVEQDDKEAVSWYRKAAEQGNAWGQNNLGGCYQNGQGVSQDLPQARQWYEKSAAQGNEKAKTNLSSLLQANPSLAKNPSLFFAPSSLKPEDKLDAKALGELLKCVAEGEQDQAEALIKKDSKLLLAAGKVTDLSGRTFDNITAFQYALWAMDYHMWTMIQKYLPTEAQAKQHALLESKGTVHGKHFDLQPLLDALKTYVDNAAKWNYDQRAVEQWCKKMGGAQKLLPAHVVNEYCRSDRSFAPCPSEWTSPLPRTRTVAVYDGSKWVKGEWFTPLNSSDALGSSVAFCRESDGCRGRVGGGGLSGWVEAGAWLGVRGWWQQTDVANLKSLQALWHARTQQLKALADSLEAEPQSSIQVGLK
jgi:hypothetical protein